jgi:hypothetical protein
MSQGIWFIVAFATGLVHEWARMRLERADAREEQR